MQTKPLLVYQLSALRLSISEEEFVPQPEPEPESEQSPATQQRYFTEKMVMLVYSTGLSPLFVTPLFHICKVYVGCSQKRFSC